MNSQHIGLEGDCVISTKLLLHPYNHLPFTTHHVAPPPLVSSSTTRMLLCVTVLLTLHLLIVSPSSPFDSAHAANVPATINIGTYTSIDDTLLTSGTTLNVPAMLVDAASNSKPEAVCTFTRTTFKGTLTITLPTTAAAWTTSNVPLRLLIEDGVSSTTIPATFIKLSGYVALGSTIVVRGGTYTYTSWFVGLPNGIMIQDGSKVAIEGGTYRARMSAVSTCILFSAGPVSLSNSGVLSISSNSLSVKDETSSVSQRWSIVLIDNTVVAASGTSLIAIDANNIAFVNLNVASSWSCNLLYAYDSQITINNASNFTVNNNDLTVSGLTALQWFWYTLFLQESDIDVLSSSLVTLSFNNMLLTALLGHVWTKVLYCDYSDIGSTGGSNLTISYNNITLFKNTGSSIFSTSSILSYEAAITVASGSTVSINNNELAVLDSTIGSSWSAYPITMELARLVLYTGGVFAINNNNIIGSDVVVSGLFTYEAMGLDDSSVTGYAEGGLAISNNNMVMFNVQVGTSFTSYVFSPTLNNVVLKSGSTFAIDSNNITISKMTIGSSLNINIMYKGESTKTTIDGADTAIFISNDVLSLSDVSVGTFCNLYSYRAVDGSDMAITNGGTLSISHNTIHIAGLTIGSYLYTYAYYTSESPTTISDGSTLSISHNTFVVTTITVTTYWYMNTAFTDISATLVSNNSLFSISDNNMVCTDIGVGTGWKYVSLYGKDASLTITINSNFTINNNDATVSGVRAGSSWFSWYALYMQETPIKVQITSLFSYSHNLLKASNLLNKGSLSPYILYLDYSDITLSTRSAITANQNIVTVSNSNVGSVIFRAIMGYESHMRVLTNSSMSTDFNELVITDVTATSFTLYEMQLEITSPVVNTGSTFSLSHNTRSLTRVILSGTFGWTILALQSDGFTIAVESTLAISNNKMILSDVGVGASWLMNGLWPSESDSDVKSGSTFTMDNNNITVSKVTVSTTLTMNFVYLRDYTEITVDGSDSTFSISNNIVVLSDVAVGSTCKILTYSAYDDDSDLLVSNGGTFAISHNTLKFADVTVTDVLWLYTFYTIEATVTVNDGSVMDMSYNTLTVDIIILEDNWLMYTFFMDNPSSLIVNASSVFSISNNKIEMMNVDVDLNWRCAVMVGDESPLQVSTSSNLTINNNEVTVSGVSSRTTWFWYVWFLEYSSATIQSSSIFSNSNNVMTMSKSDMGTSTFQMHFFHCDYSGITVSAGSTFLVDLNTMLISDTNMGILYTTSLYGFESPIRVATSSSMILHKNELTVRDVRCSTLTVFVIHWELCSPTISTSSTFSISHHNLFATNFTTAAALQWSMMLLQSDGFTASVESTLAMSNNVISMYDVKVGTTWSFYLFYPSESDSYIKTGSTFAIDNNNITASKVTVGSVWRGYMVYLRDHVEMTVDGSGSSISISNNVLSMSDAAVGGSCTTVTYYAIDGDSNLLAQSRGIITISDNTVLFSDVSVASWWTVYILYADEAQVSINTGSSISISNNFISTKNGATTTSSTNLYIALIYYNERGSAVNGEMVVGGNTVNLQGYTGTIAAPPSMLSVGSGATVSGSGRMSFHHNSVVGGGGSGEGSMMDFTAGTLGPVTPPMRTCRNYIDGQLCTLSAGGVYSCATGSSRLAGNIADCTYTNTISESQTPTGTDMVTKSESITSTHSTAATESESMAETATVPVTQNTTSASSTHTESMQATSTSSSTPSLPTTRTLSVFATPTSTPQRTSTPTMGSSTPTHLNTPTEAVSASVSTSIHPTSTPTSTLPLPVTPTHPPTPTHPHTPTNLLPEVSTTPTPTSLHTPTVSQIDTITLPVTKSTRSKTIPSTPTVVTAPSPPTTKTPSPPPHRHTTTTASLSTPAGNGGDSLTSTHTQYLSSLPPTEATTMTAVVDPPSASSTVHTSGVISHTITLPAITSLPPTPPTMPPSSNDTTTMPNAPPQSTTFLVNYCNYTCADTVALQYITPSTTPQHAIDAYLGNISTFTTTGCTALALPFTATAQGAVTTVLMHLAASKLPLNQSNLLVGMVLSTTKPGAMQASIVAANYTADGGLVVVFDVRRVDASPSNIVSGSVVLPGGSSGPFFCTPTSTLQQSGLPWANIALGAPPPALSEGERTAVAVLAMTSADLQTVAAIGMLRCSPGSDEDVESEAGIRALVPVALSGTCAGAVQGALLAIGAAGVLSVVAMCIMRAVKKKDGGGRLGWVDAAAMVRCPGVVIAVWAFVQMGLVVCGARLATSESGGSGDIVLGVVGVLAGAVLPVVCIGLAWGVVSRRCYRLAQVPEAVAGRSRVVVWARSVFLPSYELDAEVYPVSKAFSTVVGRTRRPSCVWAGLSSMQPVVMLLVAFVQGSMCNVILIVAGVALLTVGALCHVLFRPHRIVASNYLQGIAMALNAALLLIASQLVGDPLNDSALSANSIIAIVQISVSVCRAVHGGVYIMYIRLFGKGVFERVCAKSGTVSNDVLVSSLEDPPPLTSLPTSPSLMPVFDVQASNAFDTCLGIKEEDDNNSDDRSGVARCILSLFSSKTNKQFGDDIMTTLLNEGGGTEVVKMTTDRPTLLDEEALPHVEDGGSCGSGSGPEEEMTSARRMMNNNDDDLSDDYESENDRSKNTACATLSLSLSFTTSSISELSLTASTLPASSSSNLTPQNPSSDSLIPLSDEEWVKKDNKLEPGDADEDSFDYDEI